MTMITIRIFITRYSNNTRYAAAQAVTVRISCLFSAVPKASHDLLSVGRDAGKAETTSADVVIFVLETDNWPVVAEWGC